MCQACSGMLHLSCVPQRSSRSGKRTLCNRCLAQETERAASVHSTTSQMGRERIAIQRKKLEVRRKMLAIDREEDETLLGAEDTVDPPRTPHLLQVPSFLLSGPMSTSAAAMATSTAQKPAGTSVRNSFKRRNDKEEQAIRMAELCLDEDELLIDMQDAGEEEARSEASGCNTRVREWVAAAKPVGHRDGPTVLPGQEQRQAEASAQLANDSGLRATPAVVAANLPPPIEPELRTTQPATVPQTDSWTDKWLGRAMGEVQDLTQEQAARRIGGIPELPKLDGRRAEWVSFLVSFRTTTRDYGLRNSENMERLRHSIVGEPAKLLRGSMLFPHQVPEVIERLEQIYGTPEKLLGEAEDILFALPKMDDGYSYLALYASEVSYTVAVIELAAESLRNLTLIRTLERKFHPSVGMAWARYKSSRSGLGELKAFLDERLRFALAAGIHVTEVMDDKVNRRKDTTVKRPVLTVVKNEPVQPPPVQELCPMECGAAHALSACPRFLGLAPMERKTKCTDNRRCYCCLESHPFGRGRCRGKPCSVSGCGGRHHSLLHPL